LSAHRGEVVFITIDVGANDVFQYGDQATATILTYLPQILARLRSAAGPNVPILGMNYYGVGLPASGARRMTFLRSRHTSPRSTPSTV
jgi:hypothetical protein